MRVDQSVGVLVEAIRARAETSTTKLILRELSFDPQRSIYSAVMIVRANDYDRGYIWIDGKQDGVCCHSTAVSTGPLSSTGRKPFSYTDRELDIQLRSAISAILRNQP
jgi:hypothetical protein